MDKSSERAAFSARLCQQLANKGWDVNKPTWLAKQFNSRFEGQRISVQTASNWLTGNAIPSQEKLRVLAAWLETSAEWLRYGDAQTPPIVPFQGQQFGLSDLPEKLERLSPKQKRVIYDVIDAMLDATERDKVV